MLLHWVDSSMETSVGSKKSLNHDKNSIAFFFFQRHSANEVYKSQLCRSSRRWFIFFFSEEESLSVKEHWSAGREGEVVKMKAWLITLHCCLYSVFYPPRFDKFKLRLQLLVAGVVSGFAGVVYSSALQSKLYILPGKVLVWGDTWINIVSELRSESLGSNWPLHRPIGMDSQWLSFSSTLTFTTPQRPADFCGWTWFQTCQSQTLHSQQSAQLYLLINHTISACPDSKCFRRGHKLN